MGENLRWRSFFSFSVSFDFYNWWHLWIQIVLCFVPLLFDLSLWGVLLSLIINLRWWSMVHRPVLKFPSGNLLGLRWKRLQHVHHIRRHIGFCTCLLRRFTRRGFRILANYFIIKLCKYFLSFLRLILKVQSIFHLHFLRFSFVNGGVTILRWCRIFGRPSRLLALSQYFMRSTFLTVQAFFALILWNESRKWIYIKWIKALVQFTWRTHSLMWHFVNRWIVLIITWLLLIMLILLK